MAFKTVEWTSHSRLSCAGCAPADVILCVTNSKVAQKLCPTQPVVAPETSANTTFTWKTVKASLINFIQFKNTCGTLFYRYIFSYDDSLVVAGQSLTCNDISGVVCQGCLTSYVDEQVGNEIKLVAGATAGSYILTSQHGCTYEFSTVSAPFTVSADAGTAQGISPADNLQILGGASLSSVVSATDIVTIKLDLSTDAANAAKFGTDENLLVRPVSTDANNVITVGTDAAAFLSCAAINACVVATPETPNAVVDSPSVNLTASGTLNRTIQADVIRDPQVGNALQITANGLFVPAAAAGVPDTLVDNGDRTFTHTSTAGVAQNFCQGLQTITPAAGCNGIGLQNAIRALTLNGCDLVVSSAPEHISQGDKLFAQSPPFLNILPLPPGTVITNDFTIVNPSACRVFRGMLNINWSIRVRNIPGTFSDFAVNTFAQALSGGAIVNNGVQQEDEITITQPNDFALQLASNGIETFFEIPAGGTLTGQLSLTVIRNSGNFVDLSRENTAIAWFGSTT